MSWILNKGADVDQTDFNGNTAMHTVVHAKAEQSIECAKMLLEFGASLTTTNQLNYTPLDEAKATENAELVALFETFLSSSASKKEV